MPCATSFGGTLHFPNGPDRAMIDSSSQGGYDD